jgi:hypothetical protein
MLKRYTYSGGFFPIVSVGDVSTIIYGLAKYGKGGYVQRHLKVFWMWEFAKTILGRRWRNVATYKESEIATRIYFKLKPLKLEQIMSEIKMLKKYAGEVGISEKKIAKMDEEELVRAIVAAVDADKTYSKAFVAWYEDLPEEVFEEAEEEPEEEEPIKKKAKKDKEEEDKVKISAKKLERLLDEISEAEDLDELKNIIEDNDGLFTKKVTKIKDFDELQEAMVEALEEYEEPEPVKEEPVIKKKAKKEEPEEEEEPVIKKKAKKEEPEEEEVDIPKLIKKINKAEDLDDLKAIVKENSDSFDGISTRGVQKFENLKAKMLNSLGVEEEEEEKPARKKPSTESNDLEEIAKLPIPFLKKKAKEMGIKTLPGWGKDKIMALIEEKMEAGEEIEEEEVPVKKEKKDKKKAQKEEVEEVEIDQSFVNKLVKAKDLDALIDVAKELDVKISILEKKSVKRLGAKLIEFLSEKEEEVEEEAEEAPKVKKEKGKSIYKEIEKMVLDGLSEKKIVKAVTPLFEEKGEDDEDYIAKRVKQLVAIVKFDNDMEE